MTAAASSTRRTTLLTLMLGLLVAATLSLGCFGSSSTDEGGGDYCQENPENC